MDGERLFLHKVAELERLLQQTTDVEFALLSASGILRHLLLDHLLDTARRGSQVPVVFTVAQPSRGAPPLQPTLHVTYDTFWPETAPSHWSRLELNDQRFLAHRAIQWQGASYTVKHVILMAANSSGGVHHGAPREQYAGLLDADAFLLVDEVPISLTLISDIGHVVLAAVEPLRRQLHNRSI